VIALATDERTLDIALWQALSELAKTSEPDFGVIDFPAFVRVDLSGSMAAPSI
jgi:hypothetical protein